jgi:hypothetical protein
MNKDLNITLTAIDNASKVFQGVVQTAEASVSELEAVMSVASDEISADALPASEAWNSAFVSITDNAKIAATGMTETFAAAFAMLDEEALTTMATMDTEISSGVSNINKSFAGISIAATAAFQATKSIITDAVENSDKWSQTSTDLAQTLKNTGSAIPLDQLQEYATSMQNVSIFTQQDILNSEAVLMSHKNLQHSYKELTQFAMDAAASMTMKGTPTTVEAAMKIITNALADPVNGLTQLQKGLGIDISANAAQTIKSLAKYNETGAADSAILSAGESITKGKSADLAKAPGAALTEMSNAAASLSKAIGDSGLAGDIDKLAKAITKVIEQVTIWVDKHPQLTERIVATVVALTGILVVLASAVIAMMSFNGTVMAFVGTFEILEVLVGAFELNPVVLAITAVILVIVWLVALIHQNWPWIVSETEKMGTAFLNTMRKIGTELKPIWDFIWDTTKFGINLIIGGIDNLIGALDAIQIHIPSIKVGGVSTPGFDWGGMGIPKIPMLADGGIVTQATLAILGEAGPEAVVPLSSMGNYAGAGGGGNVVINIYGNISDQNTALTYANQIARIIQTQLRLKNFN